MSDLCFISQAFLSVGTFALGILSGVLGSISFYKWKFRRGGIEDFAAGIKEEIVTFSLAADNIAESIAFWSAIAGGSIAAITSIATILIGRIESAKIFTKITEGEDKQAEQKSNGQPKAKPKATEQTT
jgi:hypothetical protein